MSYLGIDKFSQIIIAGQPRSGTSMTKAIIGSHSKVAGYNWEMPFWNDYYPRFKGKKLSQNKVKHIVNNILESEAFKQSDVPLHTEEFLKYFEERRSYHIKELYQVFARLYLDGRGKNILAIKNPTIELYADEIFDNFPDTKFIHVVRNPLDNYVSLKKAGEKWWGKQYNELNHIHHWKKSYLKLLQNKAKYPRRYFDLKYEDIVQSPEDSVRALCDFLNLEFERSMLEMKNQAGWPGANSSVHSDTGSHIFYNKSIGNHENLLTQQTISSYHQLLRQELKEFGYNIADDKLSKQKFLPLRFTLTSAILEFKNKIKSLIKRTPIFELYERMINR